MTAVDRGSRNGGRAEGAGEPRGASVIVNVLDVLRCFTVERPVVGVTEIAAEVGLHKSSISRILTTLEQERVVERDEETRKYRLGLGLIAIAGPLLANLDVRRVAYPVLQDLSAQTGESAVLNIWEGSESVSIEQIASARLVKHTSALGSRYRTGLSATVQVFLSHQAQQVTCELRASGQLQLPADLSDEDYLTRLEVARQRGYAVNYGETSEDEVGVAAPVFDHRGDVVACVMLAAPRYRITPEVLDELCSQCARAARQVSVRLGFVAGQ